MTVQIEATFSGTGILIFGGHRSNYGTFTISVDGHMITNGNANSVQGSTIQKLGSVSNLVNGPHTAVLTNTGGAPIDIDFVDVETQPSSSRTTSTTIDDNNSMVQYLPSPSAWTLTQNQIYMDGTLHFTSTSGASASIPFTGDAVAVYGTMAPDHADIQFTLDGRSSSQTGGAGGFVSLLHTKYYANNLGPDIHVLSITSIGHGGGPFIDIDAITVYSSGTPFSNDSGAPATGDGSTQPPSTDSSKQSFAPIIGGVVGSVAVLLLLGLFLYLHRRRRDRPMINKRDIGGPMPPKTSNPPIEGTNMMEAGLLRGIVHSPRVIVPPKYPAPTYLPPPPPPSALPSPKSSTKRETTHSIAPSYYSDPAYASGMSSPQSSTGLLPTLPTSPPFVLLGSSRHGKPHLAPIRSPNLHHRWYAVWASFFGLIYRKFFWDFIGGTLRDPGGIQPGPNAAIFITIIVKAPIIQILSMVLGMFIVALEFPLPPLKKFAIHRSIVLRIVLLSFQAFLAILFYQGTNAAIWSLIAALCYTRAQVIGETMTEAKENRGKAGGA
ncbi:hypothetical protein C0995_006244 [Termitomyces sp. Mi166|nr:hypothetical protein C0995_006244 [Termitomyces sp. Mi166\